MWRGDSGLLIQLKLAGSSSAQPGISLKPFSIYQIDSLTLSLGTTFVSQVWSAIAFLDLAVGALCENKTCLNLNLGWAVQLQCVCYVY